ncbi:MAG: hypothetical protein ACR2P4_08595 [Gammaproteobacteria bacterium]
MTYLGTAIAQRQQVITPVSNSETIPPAVLGWNRRDPLFEMNPGFATILDNYFPQPNFVELRNGHTEHATGIGSGVVETLFAYNSGSTNKLLAFGNSAIYDATSTGAVGAALASGFTNNRWQTTNFATKGIFVNGDDAPQSYDGSTVSAAGFTGPTTVSDLIGVHPFKNRLLFVEKNTASFWYPANPLAVTGALTEFDLSGVAPSGGNLIAIDSLTIDGGSGVDDLVVFAMEKGIIIVYQGSDPGADFSLVGVFDICPPVGRRPFQKFGGDLVMISCDGYVPLSQYLRTARAAQQIALSDNISGEVSELLRTISGNFGWQIMHYPRGNWLLVNVPNVVGAQSDQHVMNTITKAWCRFKGMNAQCWEVFNGMPYFGGISGNVLEADTTRADNGTNIIGDAQTAFIYFGNRSQLKHFKMVRPTISSDSSLPVSVGLGTDFDSAVSLSTTASTTIAEGGAWDVGAWDVAAWAGGLRVINRWQSVSTNEGYSAAVRIKTETSAQQVRWFSTGVLYEMGGVL